MRQVDRASDAHEDGKAAAARLKLAQLSGGYTCRNSQVVGRQPTPRAGELNVAPDGLGDLSVSEQLEDCPVCDEEVCRHWRGDRTDLRTSH
ncbi:MAG: hypothetical protein ACK5UM_12220 [Pseudomonadota bacterium]|jgi:hypothetical protein|nr:hypothetical protein [Burkholderiaceae bacterium]